MKKILLVLTAFLCAATTTLGAEMFADNERVCFIGDSITHGGSYHMLVREYYLTRFPGRPLATFNCGISGDSAGGALQRIDYDILANKPTAATIMFGMNDCNCSLYGKKDSEVTGQLVAQRKDAIKKYTENMEKLVEILKKNNVKTTLITPTPYGETAELPGNNYFGYAATLAKCSDIVAEIAAKNNCGIISFNKPMTEIDHAMQKEDKKATIIGPDRVHPQALGHAVMAALFLKDQNVPAEVATVKVDVSKMSASTQNCKVSDLRKIDGGVSFACQADALPFPKFPELEQVEKHIPFTSLFNRETIQADGLPSGKYALMEDGRKIGEWSSEELAKGVNIANLDTPQQKQSQEVRQLNRQLCGTQTLLRNLCKVAVMLKAAKVDDANPEAVQKYMDDFLEKNKAASWVAYYKNLFPQYQKLKAEEKDNLKKIEELEKKIYAANKPSSHVFEIRKVNGQ